MKKAGWIILFIGLIMGFLSFQDSVAAIRPWVDLYAQDTNISQISTWDMIEFDVIEIWGSYATKTTTENGRKTAECGYYILPAFEGDEYRFIGLQVPEKEYALFDQIMQDTYDYYQEYSDNLGQNTTHKTGRLKKMSKEMQNYYYDWFKQVEWYDTEAEMKAEALPYYIEPIADPMTSVKILGVSIVAILVGGVIVVFGFLRERSKKEKAEEQSYVVIGGITYPKQTFAHVNASILGQEKIFAAQELAEITGISMEEAGEIVEKWNQYYY